MTVFNKLACLFTVV